MRSRAACCIVALISQRCGDPTPDTRARRAGRIRSLQGQSADQWDHDCISMRIEENGASSSCSCSCILVLVFHDSCLQDVRCSCGVEFDRGNAPPASQVDILDAGGLQVAERIRSMLQQWARSSQRCSPDGRISLERAECFPIPPSYEKAAFHPF